MSTGNFSDADTQRLLLHLGVANTSAFADVFFGPHLATSEWIAWIQQIDPNATHLVLEQLTSMDNILDQQRQLPKLAKVLAIGKAQLNPKAYDQLRQQYISERERLKAMISPVFARAGSQGGGSQINGTWSS